MKNKYLSLLLLITAFSFNLATAQETTSYNVEISKVSNIEQLPTVMLSVNSFGINNENNTVIKPSIAFSKKGFKRKVNLKLKGKIELFKIKRHTKTC